jgi:hypothetical protein
MYEEEESEETYMNRPEPRTMPSSHILIEALDGIRTCQLTVFLVHVMCTRTRVVTEPDTEVLDLQRFLFVDLKNGQSQTLASWMAARDLHTTLTPIISPLAFFTFFS